MRDEGYRVMTAELLIRDTKCCQHNSGGISDKEGHGVLVSSFYSSLPQSPMILLAYVYSHFFFSKEVAAFIPFHTHCYGGSKRGKYKLYS